MFRWQTSMGNGGVSSESTPMRRREGWAMRAKMRDGKMRATHIFFSFLSSRRFFPTSNIYYIFFALKFTKLHRSILDYFPMKQMRLRFGYGWIESDTFLRYFTGKCRNQDDFILSEVYCKDISNNFKYLNDIVKILWIFRCFSNILVRFR